MLSMIFPPTLVHGAAIRTKRHFLDVKHKNHRKHKPMSDNSHNEENTSNVTHFECLSVSRLSLSTIPKKLFLAAISPPLSTFTTPSVLSQLASELLSLLGCRRRDDAKEAAEATLLSPSAAAFSGSFVRFTPKRSSCGSCQALLLRPQLT